MITAKKKRGVNPAFEHIRAGLKNAIAHAEGRRVLTVREVHLPPAPRPMTAAQIASLRVEVLGVSQQVFAGMLNASPKSVHAWEQGRSKPAGTTLQFLRILERRPDIARELVEK